MAEKGVDSEQKRGGEVVRVRDAQWGDTMLGSLIQERGASFKLSDIYKRRQMGSQYLAVYFRTESGNIYLLDRYGNLINSRETAKQKGKISGIKLDKEDLEKMELTVGEPFKFKDGNTSSVAEIVAVDNQLYTDSVMDKVKASSSIQIEFQKSVPPKAIGEWQGDPLIPGHTDQTHFSDGSKKPLPKF